MTAISAADQRKRDEAREALIAYHKAVETGRSADALAIEQKWNLTGRSPRLVSIGLQAAADGYEPAEAIERFLRRVGR